MQPPVWQPPFRPAPVGSALLLRAPLWEPQPSETAAEHLAFTRWLMGGYEHARGPGGHGDVRLVVRGDWAAALGILACSNAQVHALAARWSWEVRGREYWQGVRALGERSLDGQADSLLEYTQLARELDRKWLELSILEVDKAIVEAKRIAPAPGQEHEPRFLARLFTNRELIQLRRADGALEIQRFRAGVLERSKESAPEGVDWSKLPPSDLEQYRQLREKARA